MLFRSVDREVDLQRLRLWIVTARRVIARIALRLTVRRDAIREEQLHVIVESEAGESFEIATERDADHVGRQAIDARHRQRAAARLMAHAARRERGIYTYFPGGSPVPESAAVNVRNRSHAIRAEITVPAGVTAEGTLLAMGSALGGFTLQILDGQIGRAHV